MITGTYTPLQLNVISGFMESRGLNLNGDSVYYIGTWTPGGYVPGVLVGDTVLAPLTEAINLALGKVLPTTFIALTSIGSSTIPALGNSKPANFLPTYPGPSDPYPPSTYPDTPNQGWVGGWTSAGYQKITTLDDPYWRRGFLGVIARQAYYELFIDTDNQYQSFCKAFTIHEGWRDSTNQTIASYDNGLTFNLGTYSNMNDLTTGDISGVTTAFKLWGQDLINLGQIFTLSDIWRAGTPSVLLRTLDVNGALTEALKMLMLYELTPEEINKILLGEKATAEQERKIYGSMKLIQDQDLVDIKITMNCSTSGLTSLADLLDPMYQFPTSYKTLTTPRYSIDTTSYKIYDLIYTDQGVNPGQPAEWLVGVVPDNIAIANRAFSFSMQQITNIRFIEPQKFVQVVANLEVTTQDLPALANTQAQPTNQELAYSALSKMAFGSGTGGTWRTCDFWGAASGVPYVFQYTQIYPLLKSMANSQLGSIYNQILALCSVEPIQEPQLLALITQANSLIASIASSDSVGTQKLNNLWNSLGSQLTSEQRGIVFSVSDASDYFEELGSDLITGFVTSITNYALDTSFGGSNQVLTAFAGNLLTNIHLNSIISPTAITQQSLIASLREARNGVLLSSLGIPEQNVVPDMIGVATGTVSGSINDPQPLVGPTQATATAKIVNGSLEVTITYGGSGYDPCQLPRVIAWGLPTAKIESRLIPIIDPVVGNIVEIIIENPTAINGYPDNIRPQIYIDPPPLPQRQGGPLVPGSQAGSQWTNYVPYNLVTGSHQSLGVEAAIRSINK